MLLMKLDDVANATEADIKKAVSLELRTGHRLLPRRRDYAALLHNVDEIAHLVQGWARRETTPVLGDVIFAQKGWRGTRPLTVMALTDAIAYRLLCALLTARLPQHLQVRTSSDKFRRSLLAEPGVSHIAVTDVTAYYEFVDHEILADELVAQTGDEPVVAQLLHVTAAVMGRNVGLPQIHYSSDRLGDTYIDPVRRRMHRQGFKTLTYSDDFRIGATSLRDARRSLEICASEMRKLGLVMNERKTFTYGRASYQRDLDNTSDHERRLFDGFESLRDHHDGHYEEPDPTEMPEYIAGEHFSASDDDTIEEHSNFEDVLAEIEHDPALVLAANNALAYWVETRAPGATSLSDRDASDVQKFLGKALPILGADGSDQPLLHVVDILRFEPTLTPQVASYLVRYSLTTDTAAQNVRTALDDIVRRSILSDWQAIWIAYVASHLHTESHGHEHVKWLAKQVESGPSAVAAHAAAALGEIGLGDVDALTVGLSRIGPSWRSLALWGLVQIDPEAATKVAGAGIERLLVPDTAPTDGATVTSERM
jgi:hypothetical protein